MSQNNWEADKMLDVYIYDYLMKRNLQASAKAFQAEGKVSTDPVAIDAPGGFLFEWWSVFWDIFISRTNEKKLDVAASYIQTQLIKVQDQQQQQQQQHQQHQPSLLQPHHQHQQMQRFLLQRHSQQQQQQQQPQQPLQVRDGARPPDSAANGLAGSDVNMCQNPATAAPLATKLYEERLNLPIQRDSLDEASMKQKFGENMGQLLDPNHASMLKSTVASDLPSGKVMHGTADMAGGLQQVQQRSQQSPGPMQDMKGVVNPVLNSRAAVSEGSLVGVPGPNQGGNNLTLKGWPLSGVDQLRSGLLQQQKSFVPSSHQFHQIQLLSPHQQQQLLLQAQQNLSSPLAGDIDSQRLRMFLNNRNMVFGRDNQSNSVGDIAPNFGAPTPTGGVFPRPDTDKLIKRIAQLQQQQQGQSSSQQQQLRHPVVSSQQSQNSNHVLHQKDKMGTANVTADDSLSNSFRGNDQVSKNQGGRKRKQPVSSSGPATSSGTGNTAGPSQSSALSTPSTHTPGDVISIPSLQHSGGSSKPLIMFGSDGAGTLTSPNQLWDDKGELLVEDGSLDDNVESFLSHDDADPRNSIGHGADVNKGFTFNEVGVIRASSSKVVCCHFSSDGTLLATGGHDKKAVLWHTDTLKSKTQLEEHILLVTDVRFSPSMPRLATSSFDKTVRVWDADNPGYSLRTFTGHSASVMSLDFHPNKEDLICSCDGDSEIRYWSVTHGSCARVFKGGTSQVRFQPRLGRYLAAAAENVVSVLDVETQACCHSLKGHMKSVHSVCWNHSGDFLASVSEDSVRVWAVGAGSKATCVHELDCSGNRFHSCAFHPAYPSLLIIGCYESLELWNVAENKTMTLSAHEGLIASLAASSANGLVASASHDKLVKLWS